MTGKANAVMLKIRRLFDPKRAQVRQDHDPTTRDDTAQVRRDQAMKVLQEMNEIGEYEDR
jgi:hypothetical protein